MTTDNLDWAAFCYLAGELNAQDQAAFEARLAEDQSAREALAQAVELTQAVCSAEEHVAKIVEIAKPAASQWSLRVSWMAIGGLAAVAAGLLVAIPLGGLDGLIPSANRANQFALAAAWTETGDQLLQLADVGLAPRGSALASDLDDEPLIGSVANLDDPMGEMPSWLTAAVLNQTGEAPEQTPDGTESL
jgi:hypothetical protein